MIVSLVPHDVCVIEENGSLTTIKPSGKLARVKEFRKAFKLDGVPVVKFSYGPIVGLPPRTADVFYIVSSKVFIAARGRDDLLRVDTGAGCVRDSQGRTQAVTHLAC